MCDDCQGNGDGGCDGPAAPSTGDLIAWWFGARADEARAEAAAERARQATAAAVERRCTAERALYARLDRKGAVAFDGRAVWAEGGAVRQLALADPGDISPPEPK